MSFLYLPSGHIYPNLPEKRVAKNQIARINEGTEKQEEHRRNTKVTQRIRHCAYERCVWNDDVVIGT